MAKFTWNPTIPIVNMQQARNMKGRFAPSSALGTVSSTSGRGGISSGPSLSAPTASGFSFDIQILGMEQLQRLNDGVELWKKYLQSNAPLSPAVRAIGLGWRANFAFQGGLSGTPWPDVTQATKELRAERGWNPNDQVLKQSGKLWEYAVLPASEWGNTQTSLTHEIPPSGTDGRSGVTHVTYSAINRTWKATISGAKAQHMYGATSYEYIQIGFARHHMPARPFWYINQRDVDIAATDVSRFIMARLGYYLPGAGNAVGQRSTAQLYRRMGA